MSGVKSNLKLGLTLTSRDQRQVNLLGDELEATIHLILAPSSHMTADTCPIAEDVVKLVVAGGQAGGVDVGVVDVDVPVHVEDGNVVAQSGGAHAGVLEDPDHGVLLVLLLLGSIEPGGVPLTHSHFQQTANNNDQDTDHMWVVTTVYLLSLGDVLELVRGGEDLPGGGVVVVGGVVRDDGAGAHEVIVLVEEDAGPRELSWRGLAMGEAGHWAIVGAGATGLGSVDWGLLTSLGPVGTCCSVVELLAGGSVGCDALGIPLEHGEVEIRSVAACLVSGGTGAVERRGGVGRSVDNPGGQLGALSWVNEALTHQILNSVQIKAVLLSGDTATLVLNRENKVRYDTVATISQLSMSMSSSTTMLFKCFT